jgi:ornithine carbamoyltransferase
MSKLFHNLASLGAGGIQQILDTADHLKATRGSQGRLPLAGKQVALVFEKASTRTRVSLEVAVSELGGHPIVLSSSGSQMGRGEPIADTARVLGRMAHAIAFRTSDESRLLAMSKYAQVPVLNALTDQSHPMQLLADLQTVRAEFGRINDLVYAWIGDGNNMAQSWIEAAGLCGFKLRLACPAGYDPTPTWLEAARAKGADVSVLRSPKDAVKDAHVISTDVFASMGQEAEADARHAAFAGFVVNKELLSQAHPSAIVLHCLPAHRGEEITEEVLEGPQSRVWDEAEARLHTAKALLLWAFDVKQ